MANVEITEGVARNLLDIVDAGLVKGVGDPVPGQMCVEAAVCFALGLPHGDDPQCVAQSLRSLKIRLNDSSWSSNAARAKGLRRLALAQLGSAGALDENEFIRRIAILAIQKSVPEALRSAAKIQPDEKHRAALLDMATLCEKEPTRENALKAKKAADAYAYAKRRLKRSESREIIEALSAALCEVLEWTEDDRTLLDGSKITTARKDDWQTVLTARVSMLRAAISKATAESVVPQLASPEAERLPGELLEA